jgi:membrane-anchored protein YejM (alkaline phosphatase superfamily)
VALCTQACTTDKPVVTKPPPLPTLDTPSTRNIVVIIIDGPRWSETFGDSTHQYMPELWQIAQNATWCTQYYNAGITNTINGISHLTTGMHSNLVNNGTQSPEFESLFQRYLKLYGGLRNCSIVASKDKLQALTNCTCADHDKYLALSNCGVAGLNTGYRDDSTTFVQSIAYFKNYKPQLSLIAFKEPDAAGHAASWSGYLDGIRNTSKYADSIIKFLNADSTYANNTDVFITNDHGRHLNGIADSFVSHGDNCEGCRHISLTVYGPDFKQQFVDGTSYDQRDVTATIAYILKLGTLGMGSRMTAMMK